MGRVKNPFVRETPVSVAREIKREIPTGKKGSAILSKGGPTTTSRLASLPHIMAVALRANVQFRSIVTSVDRGVRSVGKAGETERKENEVPVASTHIVYRKIFAIRKKKATAMTSIYIHKKNTLLYMLYNAMKFLSLAT